MFFFIILGYNWTQHPNVIPQVWIEGRNQLQPAGCISANTVLYAVCLLCCKGTLLILVRLLQQDSRFLFCKTEPAFWPVVQQLLLFHGFISSQVQDSAFALDELHEVTDSPFLQSVKVFEWQSSHQRIDRFPYQFFLPRKPSNSWSY